MAERHVAPIEGALLFNRKFIGEAFNQYRTIDTKQKTRKHLRGYILEIFQNYDLEGHNPWVQMVA